MEYKDWIRQLGATSAQRFELRIDEAVARENDPEDPILEYENGKAIIIPYAILIAQGKRGIKVYQHPKDDHGLTIAEYKKSNLLTELTEGAYLCETKRNIKPYTFERKWDAGTWNVKIGNENGGIFYFGKGVSVADAERLSSSETESLKELIPRLLESQRRRQELEQLFSKDYKRFSDLAESKKVFDPTVFW